MNENQLLLEIYDFKTQFKTKGKLSFNNIGLEIRVVSPFLATKHALIAHILALLQDFPRKVGVRTK